MKKPTHIKFFLTGIKTDQFALIDAAYNNTTEVNVNFGLQFGSNPDHKSISVKVVLNYVQNDIPFIILELSCFYKIEDADWSKIFNGSKVVLPKGFITHLSIIAVGTARGVLHAKTEGTPFNCFVLPTVNLTEIITDDVSI